jgi:tetratricopeptide (TPR) repeat protein
MLLSAIYIKSGDLDSARATLDAARTLAPEDIRVYEQMAYVAKEAGEVEDQIAAYEAIAELNPGNAEAWLALGGLYAKTGQMKQSQEAYQRVVDLDPENAYQTYYNLAVLILNRDNPTEEDTRRAIEALRKAVEIKPDYAQAWKQLAFALIGAGQRPGAAEALEKYLKYKPNAPDAGQMQRLIASLRK